MNKKLVIGIIAGVAVLLATVIAIVAISGSFSFIKPNKGDDDSSASSGSTDSSNLTSSKVDDDGNTEYTVKDDEAKKDSTISVPILINNNPGFYAGELDFTYDSDTLTYSGYEEGVIVDQFEEAVFDGAVNFMFYNSERVDVKKDGVLMVLNFKVKKAAANGEYKITIKDEGTMLGSYATGEEVLADIVVGKPEIK